MFSQNLNVSVSLGEIHCLLERLWNPQHAEGLESPDNFFSHCQNVILGDNIETGILLLQNNF